MTSSDIQIEEYLNTLSTEEFCEVALTCLKSRIEKGEDISDIIRVMTGITPVPALVTPAPTPTAIVEDNNDGTANLDETSRQLGREPSIISGGVFEFGAKSTVKASEDFPHRNSLVARPKTAGKVDVNVLAENSLPDLA